MTSRTRRLLMPAAVALLVAACGAVDPSGGTPGPSTLATPSPVASATSTIPAVSGPPVATAPPAATSPTVATIARLQAAVAANAADEPSQRDLGFALLQRVRETADPTLYAPAQAAFEAARRSTPDDALVLVGIGGLQLGKHQFADALVTGRQAVALSPNLDTAHAVVVDALIELGRYADADAAEATMLGTGVDLTTLTRVSYLAELHGKLDVALKAMQEASQSTGIAPENVAFTEALLGNLLVYTGDPTAAAAAYHRALDLVPAHAPSFAGEARLAVGAGRLDDAIALFQRAADILPLPEYVIGLGEAEMAVGRTDDATRNFKLARAEIQIFQATGVIVDVDLALFEADHGDPAAALGFAETGYKATPTVRAADALAWALHRLGRDSEAKKRSDEALRLGSRDPLFRYHAGAIAAALGDVKTARMDLQMALATDPGFSATGVAEARRILASLP